MGMGGGGGIGIADWADAASLFDSSSLSLSGLIDNPRSFFVGTEGNEGSVTESESGSGPSGAFKQACCERILSVWVNRATR